LSCETLTGQIRPKILRLYKFGMLMFALQAIYMSAALCYAYWLETQFISMVGSEQYTSVNWFKLSFFPIFIVVPILLMFLTYYKLYLPEKVSKPLGNRSSWNLTLTLLGLFFGLIVGALPFAVACGRIKTERESKSNPSSRYFS